MGLLPCLCDSTVPLRAPVGSLPRSRSRSPRQWLAFSHPDPDGVQYAEMLAACDALCTRGSHDPKTMYIFLDYLSIPQANMRQRLCCIDSLGTFSSVLRHFVVIAPAAVHSDTKLVCDKASYARRGWCRLEQWGHMCNMGMTDMYYYDGAHHTLADLDDTPDDGGSEWCAAPRTLAQAPPMRHPGSTACIAIATCR